MAPTGEQDQALVFGADRRHHRTEQAIERTYLEKVRSESRLRSAPAALLLGQAKGTAEESGVVAHRTVQAVSCSQEVAVEWRHSQQEGVGLGNRGRVHRRGRRIA